MRTREEEVLRLIPGKYKGERREFSEELKKTIMDYYDSIKGKGKKMEFAKKAEMDQNTITRWGRNRKEEQMKTSAKRRIKNAKIKSLTVKSFTGSKPRIIGTTLTSVLKNIDKEDVIQQVQMINVLTEVGYNEDKLIEKLNIPAPSMDEWKQIKDALRLISKNFDIEIKPKRNNT